MKNVNRRDFLKSAASVAGAGTVLAGAALTGPTPLYAEPKRQSATSRPTAGGPFTVPALPYDHIALAPHIDEQTMRIHHGKHHAGYVRKLNKALEGHEKLQSMRIEDLLANGAEKVPASIRQNVINNGGGHLNHSLFWENLAPAGSAKEPHGALAKKIDADFGSFVDLEDKIIDIGKSVFGSGWVWLVEGKGKKLEVIGTPNQNSPVLDGHKPLLGIDVWEHAYYLKYQNRRVDYLENAVKVLNWDVASRRFEL